MQNLKINEKAMVKNNQNLHTIEYLCRAIQADSILELFVGGRGYAGGPHSSQVNGNAIRWLMVDRVQNSVARVHERTLVFSDVMKSGPVPQQPPKILIPYF